IAGAVVGPVRIIDRVACMHEAVQGIVLVRVEVAVGVGLARRQPRCVAGPGGCVAVGIDDACQVAVGVPVVILGGERDTSACHLGDGSKLAVLVIGHLGANRTQHEVSSAIVAVDTGTDNIAGVPLGIVV